MSNTMVFKEGDNVYCPMLGRGIYKLSGVPDGYPVCIRIEERGVLTVYFSEGGLWNSELTQSVPSLYHATLENKQLLDDFFGVEFDTPEVKQSGNDLTIDLLSRGYEYVVCVAVDPPRKDGDLIFVTCHMGFDDEFGAACDSQWYKTVTPIQAFSVKANQWDGYKEWCNESSELSLGGGL
jgi:hypothetical protein